jgi:Ca-activated chloride channel family protein
LNFQHTEYLLGLVLLVPLALFFFFALRWKKKVRRELGDERLVNELVKGYSARNYNLKFLFIALAVTLCVIGATNMRKPKAGGKGGGAAGVDIMVALDVSNSMLAQDVKPNRLERAKQVLNKVVDGLDQNRMGLVVFAGQAFLQMPLTSDFASAKVFISNASPTAVPVQGTVIGDALRLCNSSLDTKERKYKTIILITDGEGHDEKLEQAIKDISEFGTVVHTVGIGSPDGAPIFDETTNDYRKDQEGNTIVSKLNEKDLQMIAATTGGEYHHFENADQVANAIVTSLSQMEKKQIGTGEQKSYTSYFQWFLLGALLLLLIEWIIPERKMKWISK